MGCCGIGADFGRAMMAQSDEVTEMGNSFGKNGRRVAIAMLVVAVALVALGIVFCARGEIGGGVSAIVAGAMLAYLAKNTYAVTSNIQTIAQNPNKYIETDFVGTAKQSNFTDGVNVKVQLKKDKEGNYLLDNDLKRDCFYFGWITHQIVENIAQAVANPPAAVAEPDESERPSRASSTSSAVPAPGVSQRGRKRMTPEERQALREDTARTNAASAQRAQQRAANDKSSWKFWK